MAVSPGLCLISIYSQACQTILALLKGENPTYFPYRQTYKKYILSTLCFSFLSFLSLFFFPFLQLSPSLPPTFCCKVTELHSEHYKENTYSVDIFGDSQLMSVSNKRDLELMSSSMAHAWPFSGSEKPYFPRLALWWPDLSTAELLTKGDEQTLNLETKKYHHFLLLDLLCCFP